MNKIFKTILMISICFFTFILFATQFKAAQLETRTNTPLLGDVDLDGDRDLDDVVKLLRHVSKAVLLPEPEIDLIDLKIDESAINVGIGRTAQLHLSKDPIDSAESITWYSEDTTIATVDENGLVTGVKAGYSTVIYAESSETKIVDSCIATVVGDKINSINTPIGELYLPPKWLGKISAIQNLKSNCFAADVYITSNNSTIKLLTIYIDHDSTEGFGIGYVNEKEIRISTHVNSWSGADIEIYYIMQDTVNYIIEQILSIPEHGESAPDTEDEELYLPWKNGGKQPPEYTWAEFEALNPGQQFKFQEYFESIDLFDEWMQRVQGESSENELYLPWEHGGKQPPEYTWEEFESLNPGQQMKFQEYFGSIDLFDEWRQNVQGGFSEDDLYLPWEDGGKHPPEYTWSEFEALNPTQQMAFQNYFGSIDLFEAWMQKAQGSSPEDDLYLPWKNGGKQPPEYTWAEFEALTPGQQMAFQNYFGSIDLFDEWFQRVQP